ncbi:MAG TPA: adenylyltransferase/cytidyltransferase family protein [Anaerolineaceae bacterium]|nr:adenylyltransferase/cytidyltransferase family protein [Anaerolineaceae bacterium]
MTRVLISGSFDDLRSRHIRFLDEAARMEERLEVLLWSDDAVIAATGSDPKFPEAERKYLIESLRAVDAVSLVSHIESLDTLPADFSTQPGDTWVVGLDGDSALKRDFCLARGLNFRVITAQELAGFPPLEVQDDGDASRKKVVVTGCYDWLHSGHVRFFEEASAFGDLYVIVGGDENVRFLKGPGHPLFPEEERRYSVQGVRFVKQALISTGWGWMDAEPEIERIRPDIYLVNEDGDKPEKRAFCEERGLEYVVLKRTPKEGLPRRESTQLRGY